MWGPLYERIRDVPPGGHIIKHILTKVSYIPPHIYVTAYLYTGSHLTVWIYSYTDHCYCACIVYCGYVLCVYICCHLYIRSIDCVWSSLNRSVSPGWGCAGYYIAQYTEILTTHGTQNTPCYYVQRRGLHAVTSYTRGNRVGKRNPTGNVLVICHMGFRTLTQFTQKSESYCMKTLEDDR